MPGEERKFKRRMITALIPTCRRERDRTASQAVTAGAPAMGVAVASETGVSVCVGKGAAVGLARSVPIGEENGCGVAVSGRDVASASGVSVGGGGVAVGSEILVLVDEGNGGGVAVGGRDVVEAGRTVGVAGIVAVRAGGVETGTTD